jgi:hypothetical protein
MGTARVHILEDHCQPCPRGAPVLRQRQVKRYNVGEAGFHGMGEAHFQQCNVIFPVNTILVHEESSASTSMSAPCKLPV